MFQELIKSGFIEKIRQVLEKNATPDFGYDACSMLARILSNASYFDSVIRSGLVLLLLGLMDEVNYFNNFWREENKNK